MKCSPTFIHCKEISLILAPSKRLLLLCISINCPERRICAIKISVRGALIIISRIIVWDASCSHWYRDRFTTEPSFLKWLNLITLLIIQTEEAIFEFIFESVCDIYWLTKTYLQTSVWKALNWLFTHFIAIIYLQDIILIIIKKRNTSSIYIYILICWILNPTNLAIKKLITI